MRRNSDATPGETGEVLHANVVREGIGGAVEGYPTVMLTAHDLHHSLAGVRYPCGTSDLISIALDHAAPPDVLEALKSLPDKTYLGIGQVQTALALY